MLKLPKDQKMSQHNIMLLNNLLQMSLPLSGNAINIIGCTFSNCPVI